MISGLSRRYLEMIGKVDQLMPMLETLAIDNVITQRELDIQKARFKKMIKRVANVSRGFAGGLRNRMNVMDQERAAAAASDSNQADQSHAATAEIEATAMATPLLQVSQDTAVVA